MSQPAGSDDQPAYWEDPAYFLSRLEVVRFQEKGRQEPYESGGSRTYVCPGKVGMFSGSQSCQGNNQKPCSLDGRYTRETDYLKPIDKAILKGCERVTGP